MNAAAILPFRPSINLSSPRPFRAGLVRPNLPLQLSTGESTSKRSLLSWNTNSTELGNSSTGITKETNEETVGQIEQESFPNESPEGDPLGAALNGVSKWLASAAFGAFCVWRHDAEAMWVAAGAVSNGLLSMTLKRVLKQERPLSAPRSDPGMPSSHAQSLFYMVIYGILATLKWVGVNQVSVFLSAVFFASGSYLSWLRVSQNFHTEGQVMVGALVGTSFAALWYWLWNEIVLEAFSSSVWVRLAVISGALVYCLFLIDHIINRRHDDGI